MVSYKKSCYIDFESIGRRQLTTAGSSNLDKSLPRLCTKGPKTAETISVWYYYTFNYIRSFW